MCRQYNDCIFSLDLCKNGSSTAEMLLTDSFDAETDVVLYYVVAAITNKIILQKSYGTPYDIIMPRYSGVCFLYIQA